MRILCRITTRHFAGGGPVFLLVIEIPATVMAVIAIAISPTYADSSKTVAYPLDTERSFGFAEGADIGSEGEKEFVIDSTLQDGRGTGSFANTESALAFQKFRFSAAGALAYYEITELSGIEDPRRVQSLVSNLRRLVDQEPAPLGLTQLHIGTLSMKRAACEAGRSATKPSCLHDDAFGRWGRACAADHAQRVARSEDPRAARLHRSRSQRPFRRAPYVGPTLYARIGRTVASRAPGDYRIPREATAPPGTLDLTNVERHQAKLQSRLEF
jgi:hypothetical protein